MSKIFSCTVIILVFFFHLLTLAETQTSKSQIFLTSEEYEKLDVFFRTLLLDSQGGYVLYGDKPICEEGVLPSVPNILMIGGELHRLSVILKEGYQVLNGLSNIRGNKDFLLSMSEKPNSYGWHEFILANRKAFLKVVRENAVLFQYVLGPKATAEKLWEQISDPAQTFSSILHEDRVLTGIVLGFGVQNSLYGSRKELIKEYLLSEEEQLPFVHAAKKGQLCLKNSRRGSIYQNVNGQPSIGYSSLKEENEDLKKKIRISKDEVKKSNPIIPWFGCIQTKETQELLHRYSKTQKFVVNVLSSDKFLEKVLSKLFDNVNVSKGAEAAAALFPTTVNLSAYIGSELWASLLDREEYWVDAFIEGMHACEEGKITQLSNTEYYQLLDQKVEANKLWEAKRNLEESISFFHSLIQKNDLLEIVPETLYYRYVREGKGKVIGGSTSKITMNYTISTIMGEVLCVGQEESLYLYDLIPGLVLGIKGMKENEVREIFIHPQWGYGETSHSFPNIALIAKVEVLKIDSETIDVEQILPFKISSDSQTAKELENKFVTLNTKVAFQVGMRVWSHYKLGKSLYHLEDIIAAFRQAQKGECYLDPISLEAQRILNALHWKLYTALEHKHCAT